MTEETTPVKQGDIKPTSTSEKIRQSFKDVLKYSLIAIGAACLIKYGWDRIGTRIVKFFKEI